MIEAEDYGGVSGLRALEGMDTRHLFERTGSRVQVVLGSPELAVLIE